MGNQLVGIAPSQIFPVEHYFLGQFGNDITFEANMGSTRFFKVAKAKCDEGLLVVKVFVKHDLTLPLEDHKDRVEYIKRNLSNAVNCLPFQRVEITDKAAYIMREYVKHSLYDRVSTRPFLTVLEKKWITFQILCALNQCHKQKICHGDIKLENILITSWNWILLSDFASYKPTYLAEDNPADYTYFFDTSRRRTCYIAPERFVKSLSTDDADENDSLFSTNSMVRLNPYYSGNTLLPSMDIFSAGCALLELWTEGTAPFELSQLLAYRREERDMVEKHLHGIENEHLRKLLASMIDLDAGKRKSAEDYLDQEKGKLFPEYFYSFLQMYLQMFSSKPIMSPDAKILRLHSDIDHCIQVLTSPSVSNSSSTSKGIDKQQSNNNNNNSSSSSSSGDSSSSNCCIDGTASNHDGLILIISVVTSCIRGLQYSNTMICALEILQKLSKYTTSEAILDRILPYILYLAQHSSTKVQVQAIETVTTCLSMVKDIPGSDANVFPEYILHSISKLANFDHSAVVVRIAFARNIAKLAKIALYFLDETQFNAPDEMSAKRYDMELNALHDIIRVSVLNLLTDPEPVVKQTLIESNICDLCAFFGKEKANDIILSHITTFLNDNDKNLRGSFYDNIAGVAGYIGWQVSDILVPLIQQGFTDSEEFVIAKAIRAVNILIELGHIKKPAIIDIIRETACYLCHPNLWIRHEICGLIATTADVLSAIDVQCKIIPAIGKFLKYPIIQVEKPEILLDSIQPAIPRQIYDNILRFTAIKTFITCLEDRAKVRSNTANNQLPQYAETDEAICSLFRRLNSDGLTVDIEMQLLAMKKFLLEFKNKFQQNATSERNLPKNGRIVLSRKNILCHEYHLCDHQTTTMKTALLDGGASDGQTTSNSPHSEILASSSSGIVGSPVIDVIFTDHHTINGFNTASLAEYTLPEKNCWQEERLPQCRINLEELKFKFKSRYSIYDQSQRNSYDKQASIYPNGWRLNGIQLAHLHEHSESVITLSKLKPNGSLFVSGSIDGTVRLWDVNKLIDHQSVHRSRQIYHADTPVYSLATCNNGESLAVGGKDGSLLVLRLTRNSSKMTLQQALNLEQNDQDGPIVDMFSYEYNPQNVIIYATLYGNIVAWDTRSQNTTWRLQNDLRHGVITTICADPTGSWLAVGTSGGKHICWDLRFRLPIAEIKHPADSWIRKITCHPTEPSSLISASQSNNEVSIWNIETGHRHTVLWASSTPVLSYSTTNDPSTTCALLTGIVDRSPFILTGSTDQRIRLWDIAHPKNSALIVPAEKDNLNTFTNLNTKKTFTYESRLIEGSQVIKEQIESLSNIGDMNPLRVSTEENPRSGPDMPSASHHDSITDLLMCKTDKNQICLVSAARDGVIKLWK